MSERCYNCFREKEKAGPCPHCGYNDAAAESGFPPPLKPGSILNGRYTVGRVLRRDSTSVSYIAHDYQSEERVVVKEYLPEDLAQRTESSGAVCCASEEREAVFAAGRERFLREVKSLAAFRDDPCFSRIIRYFEENGTVYFVTEYEQGPTLDKYLSWHGGRMSPKEAGRLLIPLMDALDRVHAAGLVQRNVAPDNILIDAESRAKLIDFGAGPLPAGGESRSLSTALKHGYAAKEQYTRSGRQGAYTDVYSLGATFYYAITGVQPPDSIERAADDELVEPSELGVEISEEAEDVLLKAMEIDPQDRYPNMRIFRRELGRALGLSSGTRHAAERAYKEPEAIGATTAVRTPAPRRHGKAPLALIVAACCLALIAFGAAKLFGGKKPAAEPALTPTAAVEVTAEPTLEPTPETTPEFIPETTPEFIPEAVPEAVPEVVPEPVPTPMPTPLPEPMPEAVPEPVPEEIPEPWEEPGEEPEEEPAPEALGDGLNYELNGRVLILRGSGTVEKLDELIPDWAELRQSIAQVVLREGITEIGENAFASCGALRYLMLPVSLERIDWDAFLDCENLKDVYYAGFEFAWDNIRIAEDSFPEDVTIHFHSW